MINAYRDTVYGNESEDLEVLSDGMDVDETTQGPVRAIERTTSTQDDLSCIVNTNLQILSTVKEVDDSEMEEESDSEMEEDADHETMHGNLQPINTLIIRLQT
jgi:hypothetical protein